MARFAPRIAWPLVEAIDALDEPGLSIAELWRRLGAYADELHLPQPSYQQTRLLVHRSRQIRAMPGAGELVLDVALKVRGPREAGAIAADRLLEKAAARQVVAQERSWRGGT